MKYARLIRYWPNVKWLLFAVAMLIGIVTTIRPAAADCTVPEQGYWQLRETVVFDATKTPKPPTTDRITGDKDLKAKEISSSRKGKGITVIYQTPIQNDGHNCTVPPLQFRETSVLLGKTTTCVAGGLQESSPSVCTLTNVPTPKPTPGPTGPGPTNPGLSQSPTCETNGNALAWVLCPVYDMLTSAANGIFNDVVQPFLFTSPISTNPKDPSFKTWSNFRVYGDIFLILALLITVIAQSIGGGMIDAYTVKKILPRVLITAILINLSVYIVAFLVDITNVIGKSLGAILTGPMQSAGAYHLNFGSTADSAAAAGLGVFGVGLLGLLAAKHFTPFMGSMSSGRAGGASFGKDAMTLMFLVLLPIFLAVLAIFITLIVRKGLILFLIMISPVAFALYVLPNTEQYFKKWWDLLLEALMVYPIIVAIFSIADILSVTILSANGVGNADFKADGNGNYNPPSGHIFAILVALFIQFIPLLAIPFAFRMAGGTLSKLHEGVAATGGKLKEAGWYAGNREKYQQRYARQRVSGQAEFWGRRAQNWDAKAGAGWRQSRFGRMVGGKGLAGVAGIGVRANRYAQQARVLSGDLSKDPRVATIAHHGTALKARIFGNSYNGAVNNLARHYEKYGYSSQEAHRMATEGAQAWEATGLGWDTRASKMLALDLANADGTVWTGGGGRTANEEYHDAQDAVIGQSAAALGDVVGAAYGAQGSTRRFDLVEAGYGDTATIAKARQNGGWLRKGDTLFGEEVTADRQLTSADYDRAAVEGALATSNTQLASIRGAGAKNLSGAMGRTLKRAIDTGDMKLAARVVAKSENMGEAGPYTAETIGQIFGQALADNKAVERVKNATKSDSTVKEAYDEARRSGYGSRIPPTGEGGAPLGGAPI